jgi:hypothetical protein
MKCPECGIESIEPNGFAFSAPEMERHCKHYNPASTCPNIQRMLDEARDTMGQKPPK